MNWSPVAHYTHIQGMENDTLWDATRPEAEGIGKSNAKAYHFYANVP